MMKIATTACLGVHGVQGLMLKRSQVAVEEPVAQDRAATVRELHATFAGNFTLEDIQAALDQYDGDVGAATDHLFTPATSDLAAITGDSAPAPLTAVAAPTAVQDLLDAPGASMDTTATDRASELEAILSGMGVAVDSARVRDVLAMHSRETNEQLVDLLMTMAGFGVFAEFGAEDREVAGATRELQLEEDAAVAAALAAAEGIDPETEAEIRRLQAEWEREEDDTVARDHAAAEQHRAAQQMSGMSDVSMPVVTATQILPAGHAAPAATAVAEGVPMMQGYTTPPMEAFLGHRTAAIEPQNAAALAAPIGRGDLAAAMGAPEGGNDVTSMYSIQDGGHNTNDRKSSSGWSMSAFTSMGRGQPSGGRGGSSGRGGRGISFFRSGAASRKDPKFAPLLGSDEQ